MAFWWSPEASTPDAQGKGRRVFRASSISSRQRSRRDDRRLGRGTPCAHRPRVQMQRDERHQLPYLGTSTTRRTTSTNPRSRQEIQTFEQVVGHTARRRKEFEALVHRESRTAAPITSTRPAVPSGARRSPGLSGFRVNYRADAKIKIRDRGGIGKVANVAIGEVAYKFSLRRVRPLADD